LPLNSIAGNRGVAGVVGRARRRTVKGWSVALVTFVLAGVIAGVDAMVGYYQQNILDQRRALKARLDKLTFYGLRTAIDDIAFVAGRGYRIEIRIQNATREPFYVMMPAVEGFVQKGYSWTAVSVTPTEDGVDGEAVVRLTGERQLARLAILEGNDYTELLPGYRHVKLTLEALLSPEENPQEEIGEKREDVFLHVKDVTHRDAGLHVGKPAFIPLRAWTLIPKEAL